MSISAATTSTNRISKKGQGNTLFESCAVVASSATSWYQGDLMCFDTSAHVVRVVAATGDAATFIGIADNQVKAGNLAGPYDGLTAVDAAQGTPDFVGPKYAVEASMTLNTGDAFTMGCKVYLTDGGDSQTVTSTDPGDHNYIGLFVDILGAVTSASAGQQGVCLIGSRYPNATGTALYF